MDINILDRNVGFTSGQREHIDRCLQFAFDRFGSHIRTIDISLTDVNGVRVEDYQAPDHLYLHMGHACGGAHNGGDEFFVQRHISRTANTLPV